MNPIYTPCCAGPLISYNLNNLMSIASGEHYLYQYKFPLFISGLLLFLQAINYYEAALKQGGQTFLR